MASGLFVGIEGGSSCTKGVLINEKGETLSTAETGGSNHWQLGLDNVVGILLSLIDVLLERAGLYTTTQLSAAGLSLSGSDGPECAVMISEALYKARPALIKGDKKPRVYNDTRAALETATNQGGVVLISGTGSNCSLVEQSGGSYNCGGWGHMLGDEGSGYWIAWRALKFLFDADDGLEPCTYSLDYIRKSMHEYFDVSDNYAMLKHLYTDYKKSFMARFTLKVVEGAKEGDDLCQTVFGLAGEMLAKHVVAVANKSDPSLFPEGLTVVCMGSVWLSWQLFSKSFQDTLKSTASKYKEIRLVWLKENGTVGAAVVGAKHTGFTVPIDYQRLTETFCVVKAE